MSIRVRFAPSPTGALHIGGIRTALFNYLLAKKHGGTFILRIEDTDQTRYVEGAEQYIIDALKWCGISPTEGIGFGDGQYAPYRQSDRFKQGVYQKYANELIDKGLAYYAFDTPQQLEAMRNILQAEGAKNQSYSHATRMRDDLGLQNSMRLSADEVQSRITAGEPYVIRLKITENQVITLTDIIRGEVNFNTNELDDKVLLKADGMPTYHLANIVDDYEMKISHVIRGEEWLPSAGHHVLIYRAFGWESVMPQFAHLPLILKPDGKGKLSKRDGAKFGFPVFPLEWNDADPTKSFDGFRSLGFDPRAVVNFLVMLGWNPGTEQEIFSLDELAALFSLEKIHKAGARFDYDKAKWFNQQYLHATSNADLAAQLHPLSIERGYAVSEAFLMQFVNLMKERVIVLKDFFSEGKYFFENPELEIFDEQTILKRWKPENRTKFHDLKTLIEEMIFDDSSTMETEIKTFIIDNGLKIGDVLPLLRIALAGTLKGPAVFDMAILLGKDKVMERLSRAYRQFDKLVKITKIEPKMDIEKQIVDQRLRRIVTDHVEWFEDSKDEKQKMSKAFVVLAVSAYLKIRLDEAIGLVTDGGQDAGIDAIYIGDVQDYEFSVTIFQAKYVFDLNKDANFPANSINIVTNSIKNIFDNSKTITANALLRAQIEEIRSRTLDFSTPNIKCVFVNNGLKWKEDGQNHIDNFSSERVEFEHFNHVNIINSVKNPKISTPITIKFSGKSFVENFNYKRVLVGKLNVGEVASLFEANGDALLESNIRKYLGLHKNRVNQAVEHTLVNDKRDNFYFYNNGITMICNKFSHNDLETRDWRVRTEGLQIINGGQSCRTILDTIKKNPTIDYSQAYILVRLYELTGTDVEQLISEVTLATNSQNPVDLRDLRANDDIQKKLILSVEELGYSYVPKRDISANGDIIPSSVAAEAIFATWRKRPHQAKFMQSELFGKFYEDIFKDLNGAQLVLAVLVYRYCDNQRRKEALIQQFPHIPYSNYFLSMIMVFMILKDLKISDLSHLNFKEAKAHFESNKENLFDRSNQILIKSLEGIYPQGYESLELRRLSAVFRRGDLMEYIEF